MSDEITRHNHYVPVWYQRGFLAHEATELHVLDLQPDVNVLPDGRTWTANARRRLPPVGAFAARDLYTTFFGTHVNDEIERRLFGGIDDRGSHAVRAYIEGDACAMHDRFQDLFEYMDAQKLRTPKGLEWIRTRYPTLDQPNLMLEMQGLRLMHCRMWMEGVREIVSAENSDIKFIVSDHPVTTYNAAFPPASSACSYPSDPHIELMGSQTVFVLDANTCLILTHVEYAKDPDSVDPTARRTNAQYRGRTLVRTDTFIRTRKLARDEVIAINALLKARTRRYIAAGDTAALFPERTFDGDWKAIGNVLRPRDELFRFGGETYIGHNDGNVSYQDAFGRTSRSHEYLAKPRRDADPAPREPCGCGSNRPFGECCASLIPEDRPSWAVLGIRERNLALITAIEEILGLDKGKTWEDVRRELSDDHVVAIHKAIADLWPPDTDLEALLPRPQHGRLRALYFGVPDFRMLEPTITGWLAYFDEIVIVHPFTNPVSVRPEYSPVVSPAQHREQTLKNVLLFLELEPYIGFGLLHVIPDPGDFNAEFGWNAMRMAEERTSAMELDEESARRFQGMYGDEALRYVRRLPEPALRRYIKQQTPSIPDALLDEVVAHMKAQLNDDPIALLQPLEVGTANAQLRAIKGYSLEGALYLATLTGSIVYTDVPIYWRQLHEHTVAERDGMDPVWMPMVEALRHVEYPLGVHARAVLRPRLSDAFDAMRTALRAVGDAAANRTDARAHEALAASLRDAVEPMRRDWNPMSAEPWVGAQLEFSVPRGGFARQEVHRLLITYGKARTVVPVAMALLVRYTSPRNFSTETSQSADAADAENKDA